MAELTTFKANQLYNNDHNSNNYSTMTSIVMSIWYLQNVRHYSTVFMHINLFNPYKMSMRRKYFRKKDVDRLWTLCDGAC